MSSYELVIGNKNYSSWSMRPWVLMRALGIPFTERNLSFNLGMGRGFRAAMLPISPAARVPVLLDAGTPVWDSLAIAEHLHERHPQAGVWPTHAGLRSLARSVCAEMHAGFGALRQHCPMNIELQRPDIGERVHREHEAVQRDVQRIDQMWCDALARSQGPYLMGAFSNVDAFYAPVVSRCRSYGLPLSQPAQAYADRLWAHPAVVQWATLALAEHDFVAEDEPYRSTP